MSFRRSLLRTRRSAALAGAAGVALSLGGGVHARAQTAEPATSTTPTAEQTPRNATPSSGPVVLSGSVLDPDGAAVPGASITLTPASGQPFTTTSEADGSYTLRGAPAGTYSLTVSMPGFAPFVRLGLRVTPGTPLTLNPKLAIQNAEQTVNVTTQQNAVSVDQDANASSTVLKGDDLKALSDDPDELQNELTALAGPAAGPNGGQIYIDGFTGGQLPPKSSIREIRVNQNPFSAQYDRVGFGRVEVFTKPGADKLHGSIQLNGADRNFNTGSPYVPANTFQPDYHSIFGFGSVTGPINKSASYSMNGSYRNIQDNTVANPPALYATSQTSGVPCQPGQTGCTIFQLGAGNGYTFVNFNPQLRWDVSPRLDIALGSKNTLTARFQYEHNGDTSANIGGDSLRSQGYNSLSTETTLQLSDTQIVSSRLINETRFEFQRSTADTTPYDFSPTILVQGAFLGGGLSAGAASDTNNHIELQNYTSVALTHHFLRLGGRLRTSGETNTTNAGANGTFVYNSICDYTGQSTSTCTPSGGAGVTRLSQYSITRIATPTVSLRNTDVGLYAEDDWKVRPNLTLSYGLRYEAQNFIPDQNDFAPRLSVAYGVAKKTVIRAGVGVFYDRFPLTNQFSVVRNNGTNQQQFIIASSAAAPISAGCTPSNPAACPAATAGRLTVRTLAGRISSPYSIQANFGVDQQLSRAATVSVNYQHIRGVHQYNSQVGNFGATTGTRLYQYQSEGIFNQDQLIANTNFRGFHGITLFGFYVLSFARANTSGINTFSSNPTNLSADYGRAIFDIRQRMFLGGNVSLPYGISLSPLMGARSGSPYNITSGTDVNNDSIYNDRAVLVAPGTVAGANQLVKTVVGCGTFATPGTGGISTPAPINYCSGPANFVFNLRASKTFGFGKRAAANADAGPGGGGPRGPRPGGGGGGRRGPDGFGGGGSNSGKRYNVTLGAQAQNLFNVVDRTTPVGTLTSTSFGQPTQLAGGFFTTDSAVRRVNLQLSFSF